MQLTNPMARLLSKNFSLQLFQETFVVGWLFQAGGSEVLPSASESYWELFAKLAPALFLLLILVLVSIGTAWVRYDVAAQEYGEEFKFLNTLKEQTYLVHLNQPTRSI